MFAKLLEKSSQFCRLLLSGWIVDEELNRRRFVFGQDLNEAAVDDGVFFRPPIALGDTQTATHRSPRHPILAARAVMETTEHVFLAGDGAKRFCENAGLELQTPEWFSTEHRLNALKAEMKRRKEGLPDDGDPARKHGTVGAVALDRFGHLAAATSTGGMTAKTPGRVGDSPVIGAGTRADDTTAAISATGHGEYFIRWAVGHEIDARMRWAGQDLQNAAGGVVTELGEIGGSGGLVAVDAKGNICLPFNSPGMYRAWCGVDGVIHTGIYRH